jgi:hypothetical protein
VSGVVYTGGCQVNSWVISVCRDEILSQSFDRPCFDRTVGLCCYIETHRGYQILIELFTHILHKHCQKN